MSANLTRGWRHRLVNGRGVFALDLTRDGFAALCGNDATLDATLRLLARDFVARFQAFRTPLHDWLDAANPYADRQLRVGLLDNDGASLQHSESRSVRSVSVPTRQRLRLLAPAPAFEQTTFNLLFIRLKFVDLRANTVFNEYIIAGVLLGGGATFEFGDLVPNCDVARLTQPERQALLDRRLPTFLIEPFGDDVDDEAALSNEQLLSFCVRWHVTRKGGSLFRHVTQDASAELNAQLLARTVRFFPNSSVAVALLGNRRLLPSVARVCNALDLSPPQRAWLARQLGDAVAYSVTHHVVARGPAACALFFETVVRPALAFFVPLLVVRRDSVAAAKIEVASLCRSALQLDLLREFERHKPIAKHGEAPHSIENGFLRIPLSTACHLFASVFQQAVDLVAHVQAVAAAAQTQGMTAQLAAALPLPGGDIYAERRPTTLDDYPIGGVDYNLCHGSADELFAKSLPERHGLVPTAEVLALRRSSSTVPIRKSSSVIAVSAGALFDVCSSVDIEDLGAVAPKNSVAALLERRALPLCARSLASVYRDTGEYNNFGDRGFLYRFLVSLKMPEIDHDAIAEVMLVNTADRKLREHTEELKRLRTSTTRFLANCVAKNREKGLDQQTAEAEASCGSSCATTAKNGRCPYRDVAANTIGSERRLEELLRRLDPELRDDEVARVVTTARQSRSAETTCRQEFIETRRRINPRVEPFTDDGAIFTHGRHYVYASADHWQRAHTKTEPE